MLRLRLVVVIALILPTVACVTVIRDLSVGPVSVLKPPAVSDWPVDHPVISVSLRTHKNLSRVAEPYLIDAETVFCDSPRELTLLGPPFIYVGWPPILLAKAASSRDDSGTYTYEVLMDMKGDASPKPSREVGFDFISAPRSVCIKIKEKYFGSYLISNTVEVSAVQIREALDVYQAQ